MACNSCAKSFSFLRKEKGCPGCGFSYCPQCLCKKVFLQKINADAKVCMRCSRDNATSKLNIVEAPDAYYKRLLASRQDVQENSETGKQGNDPKDKLIQEKLQKLKGKVASSTVVTEDEISNRFKKIKEVGPTASDDEISERLAKLRGLPNIQRTEPSVPKPDLRTEQEQADDLLKKYIAQTNIDVKYKDEFDYLVGDMEKRLENLRGSSGIKGEASNKQPDKGSESEDDETAVNKIIEKLKAEGDKNKALADDENIPCTEEELPFCEICNEDAVLRCLGCKYLFCKQCFNEHKDDDDGCDKYEPFNAPKHS